MNEKHRIDPRTSPHASPGGRRAGVAFALGLALVVGFLAGQWARAATPVEAPEARLRALPPIRRELPREYREWLPKPIDFDHMYRRDAPPHYQY